MKKILIFAMLLGTTIICVAQQELNTLLSNYNQSIKVCNTPYAKSCIYETNYVRTSVYGNRMTIEYGFSYDPKYGDYISHNTISFDLTTALIYSGYWSVFFGSWSNVGDRSIITIEDKNGIDMTIRGAQKYNQGTTKKIVESICFSFETVPLANRVLEQFKKVQEGKRIEPAPWEGKPKIIEETQSTQPQTSNNHQSQKKSNNNKAQTSKSGRYVQ